MVYKLVRSEEEKKLHLQNSATQCYANEGHTMSRRWG